MTFTADVNIIPACGYVNMIGDVNLIPACLDVNRISACAENHKLSFYCLECSRLFCGDCSTRTHRGPLKGHEVEDVDERVAREGTEVQQLEAQLKELSENAKLASVAKDAIG